MEIHPDHRWSKRSNHAQAVLYIIKIMSGPAHSAMLAVALAEAHKGLAEGGIPIGAAIFDATGKLVGSGRNRRV
ncbi:MAG: hypothetical protein ABSA54_12355 [Terriglobales bacterium]|jgi:hypothetical protein